MKFRTFLVPLLALAALVSCQNERENLGIPAISFEQETLTFDANGGESKINVTVSRDWSASTEAEWLGLGKTSGVASVMSQAIDIVALPNDGYDRSTSVTFVVGKKLITRAYTIFQEGPLGEAPITGQFYEYSLKSEGQGSYTIQDVEKPDALEAVWTYDNRYGMKATAYYNSQNYASESWLISPVIEVPDVKTCYVSFTHAGQYFGNITSEATFWVAEEAEQLSWEQLTIPKYPGDWTFVNSGDIDVSAYTGKNVRFAFKYTSTASKAGTWEVDALALSTTKQGDDNNDNPAPEGVIYFNNFDKELASQTYGSGSSWPYLDQFEGWQNHTGSGVASVTYDFSGMSARANSQSNSTYSDYDGSGSNNLFFGASSYFNVKGIDLGGATSLTLSFGTEMYDSSNKEAPFDHSNFKVYASNTGEGASWVQLDYTFPAGDKVGRWDVANVDFNVPSGTSTLYLYIAATKGSVYRLDDLTLAPGDSAPLTLDFSKGVDLGTQTGDNSQDPGPGPTPDGVIYGNDFDRQVATQTYGSGSSWPYLDQFEGWKNESGNGASNVEYEYSGMSARANSNSDGNYSIYSGSGSNNLFFGASSHFQIRKIILGGTTSLALSFGSEKYTQANSLFSKDEFKVYVSDTAEGSSWVSLDYSFASGSMPEGKWDLATAYFTVPSGTTFLNIYIVPSVASAYRIDDISLAPAQASATSQSVDFSNGVDLGTTGIDGDSSVDPGTSSDPTPSDETLVFEESFSEDAGVFYIEDVTLPSELEYIWSHDDTYHNMKASAYKDGAKASESWLIMEEPIDLSGFSSARLTFEHTGKFFSNPSAEARVFASVEMQQWQELHIPNWFSNNDWTFVSSGDVDLSAFAGEPEVFIAFAYTSTASAAGTWELKNLKVYASGSGSGTGDVSNDPGPTPTPSDDPSPDPSIDPDGTVTYTVDQDYLAANKSGDLSGMVSYTNSTDYGNNVVTELRVYKSQTLSFSSNFKIVSIKMTHTANNETKQGNSVENMVECDTGVAATIIAPADSKESEISIPAGSNNVKLTASKDQIRITKLSVTVLQQ